MYKPSIINMKWLGKYTQFSISYYSWNSTGICVLCNTLTGWHPPSGIQQDKERAELYQHSDSTFSVGIFIMKNEKKI